MKQLVGNFLATVWLIFAWAVVIGLVKTIWTAW